MRHPQRRTRPSSLLSRSKPNLAWRRSMRSSRPRSILMTVPLPLLDDFAKGEARTRSKASTSSTSISTAAIRFRRLLPNRRRSAEAEATVRSRAEEPDLDQFRVVGPLRIGIPLFNIFLNEADELVAAPDHRSRRMVDGDASPGGRERSGARSLAGGQLRNRGLYRPVAPCTRVRTRVDALAARYSGHARRGTAVCRHCRRNSPAAASIRCGLPEVAAVRTFCSALQTMR